MPQVGRVRPGERAFGGIPHDEILYRLERTDPDLVADVRGNDPLRHDEDDYDDYVRAEIIDRSPDPTGLESDHTGRDPALARTMVNLRYNGGRGPNDHRGPHHPEMFIGFTGNDPRGADTQPRLEQARGHMTARFGGREARMGHNVGHGDLIEADRPWGGDAMEYSKQELFRRVKENTKIFSTQKVGRPWGRNLVADDFYGSKERRRTRVHANEGLHVPEEWQPSTNGPQVYEYAPVRGAEEFSPRRVDRPADADTAPWRNTRRDTEAGRQIRGQSTNRRVLAEGMSAAAAHRRAVVRHRAGDTDFAVSARASQPARSAPELARDIARAARHARRDQPARAAGQIQDHEQAISLGAGLGGPPGDQQAALQSTHRTHEAPANARLANAGAMVKGLREGASAKFRQVAGLAVAAGQMGTATGETAARMTGGGLAPGADYTSTLHASEAPLVRAAAADGLEVHNYGASQTQNTMNSTAVAQAGGIPTVYGEKTQEGIGRREGRSKAPQFRSHTQIPASLGDEADKTFGSLGEHAGAYTGGKVVGSGKGLRATTFAGDGSFTPAREFGDRG